MHEQSKQETIERSNSDGLHRQSTRLLSAETAVNVFIRVPTTVSVRLGMGSHRAKGVAQEDESSHRRDGTSPKVFVKERSSLLKLLEFDLEDGNPSLTTRQVKHDFGN